MIIDSVDPYLPVAGSIDKAARVPGQFLAWCAQMQLLSADFEEEHSSLLVRCRFREIEPSEFFIVSCGGELSDRVLNERGQQFARVHYAEFAQTLPELVADFWQLENEWWLFERSAKVLNERLLGKPPARRAWWQFWRRT